MKNVLLTDHDTVLMDFTVTKPEKEREEITNPYSTKINLYDLEKLTDEGWRNIARYRFLVNNVAKYSLVLLGINWKYNPHFLFRKYTWKLHLIGFPYI